MGRGRGEGVQVLNNQATGRGRGDVEFAGGDFKVLARKGVAGGMRSVNE